MGDVAQPAEAVRFGSFEADLRTQELRKAGVRIRLTGQSFQVLTALLSRPGTLVTREELQHQLWPADSFGDFEHGLNAAVNRLREALGDSADHPRYIETLPRRGYRFIAAVQPDPHQASPGSSQPVLTKEASHPANVLADALFNPASTVRTTPAQRIAITATALVLAILAALVLHLRKQNTDSAGNGSAPTVTLAPLTSLAGSEFSPALSPDGSQVVFAWDGGHSDTRRHLDLFVKVIGTETVERLTQMPALWLTSAWSPDGTTIAFTRETRKGTVSNVEVFLISARGGPTRKIAGTTNSRSVMPASASWTSDSRELIYTYDYAIRAITLETGTIRDIDTSPCTQPFAPSVSPDGFTLVFGCYVQDSWTDFYALPQAGGKAVFLFRPRSTVTKVAWSNDSKRLIFANEGGLFEIGKGGGPPHRLSFGEGADLPDISLRENRMAYVKSSAVVNLWRVNLGKPAGPPTVLAPTSSIQRQPSIAPDGKRLAFESDRSGFHEVWASNLDGSDAIQLTHLHTHNGTGSPKWSPDGQEIVFDSRATGRPALYVVDTVTARPKILPVADLDPSVPTWSRDGHWIYFRSGNVSKPGIYKVSRDGGVPTHISATDGFNTLESSDGKLLYFTVASGEIRTKSLLTGVEHPLMGMPRLQAVTEWVLTSSGIYFVDVDLTKPAGSIDFFDLALAKITRRIPLDKMPVYFGGLSLSPDGTWLAYSQIDEQSSDLMLAEGFQ